MIRSIDGETLCAAHQRCRAASVLGAKLNVRLVRH
jgi:hypothetical protein